MIAEIVMSILDFHWKLPACVDGISTARHKKSQQHNIFWKRKDLDFSHFKISAWTKLLQKTKQRLNDAFCTEMSSELWLIFQQKIGNEAKVREEIRQHW